MSTFECCESNHTLIKESRRSTCLKSLDEMIERRARSLFASNNVAEARFSLCELQFGVPLPLLTKSAGLTCSPPLVVRNALNIS